MAQIFPRRVPLLDPLDFPISLPCLHSSLNNASVVNALKILEPDEPMTLIFLRETGNRPGAVLFHTPRQIVGDAAIDNALWLVGEDVDIAGFNPSCATAKAGASCLKPSLDR